MEGISILKFLENFKGKDVRAFANSIDDGDGMITEETGEKQKLLFEFDVKNIEELMRDEFRPSNIKKAQESPQTMLENLTKAYDYVNQAYKDIEASSYDFTDDEYYQELVTTKEFDSLDKKLNNIEFTRNTTKALLDNLANDWVSHCDGILNGADLCGDDVEIKYIRESVLKLRYNVLSRIKYFTSTMDERQEELKRNLVDHLAVFDSSYKNGVSLYDKLNEKSEDLLSKNSDLKGNEDFAKFKNNIMSYRERLESLSAKYLNTPNNEEGFKEIQLQIREIMCIQDELQRSQFTSDDEALQEDLTNQMEVLHILLVTLNEVQKTCHEIQNDIGKFNGTIDKEEGEENIISMPEAKEELKKSAEKLMKMIYDLKDEIVTGIEDVPKADAKNDKHAARKIVKNGKIVIQKDGREYDIGGY